MTTARAMIIVGAITIVRAITMTIVRAITIAGTIETSYNKACPNQPFVLEGKE